MDLLLDLPLDLPLDLSLDYWINANPALVVKAWLSFFWSVLAQRWTHSRKKTPPRHWLSGYYPYVGPDIGSQVLAASRLPNWSLNKQARIEQRCASNIESPFESPKIVSHQIILCLQVLLHVRNIGPALTASIVSKLLISIETTFFINTATNSPALSIEYCSNIVSRDIAT